MSYKKILANPLILNNGDQRNSICAMELFYRLALLPPVVVRYSTRYFINDRITAMRKVIIAARMATIPINAGKPWTDPLKLTAQESRLVPALRPALPFHFDHREASPSTNRTADAMNSLCTRMAAYCALNGPEVPNQCHCRWRGGTVN